MSEVPHGQRGFFLICQARSKRTGQQCRNYAMKDKRVCRIHGGLSCGPKTEAGKLRQKMASWKHGMRSKEAIAEKRAVAMLIRQSKELILSLLNHILFKQDSCAL